MTKKKPIEVDYPFCYQCGCELSDENARKVPYSESVNGYSFLCYDCQQKLFDRIAETQGKSMALYLTCCLLNVCCKPVVLDGVEDEFQASEAGWIFYLSRLEESGENRKGNKQLTFKDGITYMLQIFGKECDQKTFAQHIFYEHKRIEAENERLAEEDKKYGGTRQQRERWGKIPFVKGLALTTEIYDELDRLYRNKAAEFKGQNLSLQQEDTIMEFARLKVIKAFYYREGKPKAASDTQKDIDNILASEQMRKKDEKPVENFRPDAWIDAFEKAGIMENGQFMPLPEISQAMVDIMRGKGYKQTLDCAHQLELNIVNNAKRNGDQPIIYELPEDMKITDELGEFADEESDEEREAKEYAHLTPVRFEKKE